MFCFVFVFSFAWQREWYNKRDERDEIVRINNIPDIYLQKQEIEDKVKLLKKELKRMETITEYVLTYLFFCNTIYILCVICKKKKKINNTKN